MRAQRLSERLVARVGGSWREDAVGDGILGTRWNWEYGLGVAYRLDSALY